MAGLGTGTAQSWDSNRLAIALSAVNIVLFTLMSLAQWAAWGGVQGAEDEPRGRLVEAIAGGGAISLTNLGYGTVVIVLSFAARLLERSWAARIAIVAGVALVASTPRVLALLAIRSTPSSPTYVAVEVVAGVVAAVIAVGTALLTATLVDQARTQERRRKEEAVRAARAVEDLQEEEMRVRRMVSAELHGTLQFRLVSVTAALDAMGERVAAAGHPEVAGELRGLAETVEEIREEDVRSLSHAVFPAGAELGAKQAIDLMLRRLPPTIATSIDLGPEYRRLIEADGAPLPVEERLVVIYTVEEAVTNALKHGHAQSVRVFAEARRADIPNTWVLDVTVDDDGTGPEHPEPPLHGLERHRQRIANRGGALELTRNPSGGGSLRFSLPFERRPAEH